MDLQTQQHRKKVKEIDKQRDNEKINKIKLDKMKNNEVINLHNNIEKEEQKDEATHVDDSIRPIKRKSKHKRRKKQRKQE